MNRKKIAKKIAMVLCIALTMVFAFALTTAPAQAQTWKGNMQGTGYTDTSTNLTQWKSFSGGCGNSCGKSSNMNMGAQQSGNAGLRLSGKEQKVDLVKGSGDFGYNTGYSQKQAAPGSFQESWGSQYGEVSGTIKSH